MRRWFIIEVTLLAGRYHGQRRDGREEEWPPAPHRLFQALIAAAHLGARSQEWSDAKAAAFRWLEKREPPEIVAPGTEKLTPLTLAVPYNDSDKAGSAWEKGKNGEAVLRKLRTFKTLCPQTIDDSATIHFLWPIAEEEWCEARPHINILCAEAKHLHSLGLGIDLAVGNGRIIDETAKRALPGDVWLSDDSPKTTRTPCAGSLQEILDRHKDFLRRIRKGSVVPFAKVRWIGYRRRSDPQLRPVHGFSLVQEDGAFASFDARKAIHIAAWMRHAAHEAGKRLRLDQAFVEQFVCGHGNGVTEKNDRFSYLPLPTIGHKHADGRVRRVLLAEPFGEPDGRARPVIRTLSNGALIDTNGEVRADMRAVPNVREERKVFQHYLKPAQQWGSVTPIVLPGLDDKRSRKAIALVVKALAQADYSTPVAEIAVQLEPVFAGAEIAGSYLSPKHLKAWPRVHAIITFAEPVPGPIAIGGGRHSGLGVFAALD